MLLIEIPSAQESERVGFDARSLLPFAMEGMRSQLGLGGLALYLKRSGGADDELAAHRGVFPWEGQLLPDDVANLIAIACERRQIAFLPPSEVLMSRSNTVGVAAIPLQASGQVIGALLLTGQPDAALSRQGIAHAYALAQRLAQGLSVLRRHQQRSAGLSELLSATEAFHRELSSERVLDRIAQGACALGFRRAVVNVFDRDRDQVIVAATSGLSGDEQRQIMGAMYSMSEFEGLLDPRFRVGRSYLIRAGEVDWERLFPGRVLRFGATTGERQRWTADDALLTPLTGPDGATIGAISVDGPLDGLIPDAETIAALEHLAAQAALALETARLSQAMQRELSERRRAEERLTIEQRQKDAILNGVNEIILMQGLDYRLQWANQAAASLAQRTTQEMVGQYCYHVLQHRSAPCPDCPAYRAIASGAPQESRMVLPDGHTYLMRIYPVRDDQGHAIGMINIGLDVTKDMRAQESLQQTHTTEAIGFLAGGVAHQFNNLLTVIQGYAYLMRDDLDPAHPMQRELQEIVRASEVASGLARQLLSFSRRQRPDVRTMDVNAVVRGMARLLEPIMGSGVRLVLDLDPNAVGIHSDANQIEQVILNLATNARDAMPSGGTLTLRTAQVMLYEPLTAFQSIAPPGRYVVLEAIDSGIGLSEQAREHLFEPFFTTKEAGQGTGLGLSVVLGIVRQCQGHICVDSRPGRGTRFSIYLPQAPESDEAAAPAVSVTLPLGGNEQILIVDDDAALRQYVERVLRQMGYRTMQAATADEALALIAPAVDLALLDLLMPDMDGQVLASCLRATHETLRVLYMSGMGVHTERLPHDLPLIAKPFLPDELASRVREALDAPPYYG